MPFSKLTYDQIEIGASASRQMTLTPEIVARFCRLVGDENPVHFDEEYAAKSFFRKRIAHGMLSAGLVSGVIGSQLPGPGAIYLSQSLEFKRPVGVDETITARVEVVEKYDKHRKLKMRTWVENQAGQVVLDGWAVMLAR